MTRKNAKLDSASRVGLREVEFIYESPEAREVYLAGDFNDWRLNAQPLRRDEGGVWCAKVRLAPGRHEYRFIVDGVRGEGHWYRGNWDLVGEAFGGRQFSPGDGYVAGLTPILRYHYATGTRWIPFAEAGAGVAGATIGRPDLAKGFEFHLLTGVGLQWFYRDDLTFNIEYRFGHVSNAGTQSPNHGLNTNELLLGVTWFF